MATGGSPKSVLAIEEESIDSHELKLASELRSLCTCMGEEREGSLADSARIFLELGRLYLRKAVTGEGMLSKLSFIKSCGLLNCAKVRFQRVNCGAGLQEVQAVLLELYAEFIKASGINNSELYISKVVDDTKGLLRKARQDCNAKVAQLAQIDDSLEGDERWKAEEAKIDEIKALNSEIVVMYHAVVYYVSSRCIQLLGPPPCEFAIAGLGSLAREEITLYSDFEHIIILQEGVQYEPFYADAKEYFRWFTVLFQLVVLGLGETFLRSLGVKSINDLYSGDKAKNWFFDYYTPCGIAFDGMVPHSCNTPLGRQHATPHRKHTVELIQPASVMAAYLTSGEDIKNGYYLKDILTRTSHLFGEFSVYKTYIEACRDILTAEDQNTVVEDQLTKICRNPNEVVGLAGTMSRLGELHEVKGDFYRPVTALISYIGRMHNVIDCSSFVTVDVLHARNIVNPSMWHILRFSVAVACEIRLKAYSDCVNQRHAITAKELLRYAGQSSLITCWSAIFSVCEMASRALAFRHQYPHLVLAPAFHGPSKRDYVFSELCFLRKFGHTEQAAELAMRQLDQDWSEEDKNKLRIALGDCMSDMTIVCYERSREILSQLELSMAEILSDTDSEEMTAYCYEQLCYIYKKQQRFVECLKMCEKYFNFCWRSQQRRVREMGVNDAKNIRAMEIEMRISCDEPVQLIDFAAEALAEETVPRNIVWLQIAFASGKLGTGDKDEARQTLRAIVESMRTTGPYLSRNEICVLLLRVISLQVDNDWWNDALVASDVIRDVEKENGTKEVILWADEKSYRLWRLRILNKTGKFAQCAQELSEVMDRIPSDSFVLLNAIVHGGLSQFSRSHDEQVTLLMFAVRTIMALPDAVNHCSVIADSLSCLMRAAQPDEYLEITLLYGELPQYIRDHDIVQTETYSFLMRIYFDLPFHIFSQYETHSGALAMFIDTFFRFLRSPVMACFYGFSLSVACNENLRDEVNFFKRRFTLCHTVRATANPNFNLAFSAFFDDQEACVKALWRVVVLASEDAIEWKKSIEFLLAICVFRNKFPAAASSGMPLAKVCASLNRNFLSTLRRFQQ